MDSDSVDKLVRQWQAERPDLDVTGLGVAVRIERLAKLLRRRVTDGLAGLGLKIWEYDVLSALRRHGPRYELPASDLARTSLLTAGAMTTRIDGLEARGLVQRRRDPNDRRGVHVKLTRRGRSLADRAIRVRLRALGASFERLNRGERAALERGLRKLLLSLDVPDAEDEAEARQVPD